MAKADEPQEEGRTEVDLATIALFAYFVALIVVVAGLLVLPAIL